MWSKLNGTNFVLSIKHHSVKLTDTVFHGLVVEHRRYADGNLCVFDFKADCNFKLEAAAVISWQRSAASKTTFQLLFKKPPKPACLKIEIPLSSAARSAVQWGHVSSEVIFVIFDVKNLIKIELIAPRFLRAPRARLWLIAAANHRRIGRSQELLTPAIGCGTTSERPRK